MCQTLLKAFYKKMIKSSQQFSKVIKIIIFNLQMRKRQVSNFMKAVKFNNGDVSI